MSLWAKNNGLKMEQLAAMRKALIDGGIVQDIPSRDMTPEGFDALCRAIESNYPDALRKTA